MLCNITQNAMGQAPGGGGYPARSSWGGGTLPGQDGEGYPGRIPPWPGQDGGLPCWGYPRVQCCVMENTTVNAV